MCEGAGKPFPVSESVREILDKEFADLPEPHKKQLPPFKQFYTPTPTAECPTGIRGRVAVFEILKMNEELEQVVLKNPVEDAVYAAARSQGLITMREDAIIKALAGRIPFEEINAIGGEFLPGQEAKS